MPRWVLSLLVTLLALGVAGFVVAALRYLGE